MLQSLFQTLKVLNLSRLGVADLNLMRLQAPRISLTLNLRVMEEKGVIQLQVAQILRSYSQ